MITVHGCPLARLGEKDAGGMNVYVRELSRGLGRAGIAVDIFTRCQDIGETEILHIAPNVRLIHLQAGEPRWIPKDELFQFLPQFLSSLEDLRRSEGLAYDLIHAHYWLSGWVALRLRELWHAPVVQMFHTLAALKNRVARSPREAEPLRRLLVEREIVREADILIAANPIEQGHLIEIYGADPDRIRIVPCGVNTELFRPYDRQMARTRLHLGSDPLVLFAGRLEPIKGVDILLQAMARIAAQGHPARLCVVGGNLESEAGQRLVSLRTELGLQDRVTFCGAQEQFLLPYYYSAADVVAMPSFYESFGMVAIEAMACGRPVVASRAGGLQFTIQDGENGLLVPPGDDQALAEALLRILTDPDLADCLGRRAMCSAYAYSWDRVTDQMRQVYTRCLAVHMTPP